MIRKVGHSENDVLSSLATQGGLSTTIISTATTTAAIIALLVLVTITTIDSCCLLVMTASTYFPSIPIALRFELADCKFAPCCLSLAS